MTLGSRLKQLREGRGLTQEQLSEGSGVRQALISELETGVKNDTTGRNLQRLARFFGMTVDVLLHGEESEDVHETPHTRPAWKTVHA